MSFLSATFALCGRELLRFVRQRSRVVGALGPPLIFWFVIGSGLSKTFQPMGAGVALQATPLQYFFPGSVALVVLFTAIFSTISIIEDRHQGFLQAVLVSPAPRSSILLGKILGGTILAVGQGLLFLLLMKWVPLTTTPALFVALLCALFLMAFGLTCVGFCIAWRLDSTQGFHAVMNLLLMPMWFLSGALFPVSSAPSWLAMLMKWNPMTYGVSALGQTLVVPGSVMTSGGLSLPVCLGALTLFATASFMLSYAQLRR